ncbi:MAG: glycosyltransferase [Clostridia bacterium]|nr:glycosyltransferase [Clostridia bacterium]
MKNHLFIVTESKSANGICCKAVMQALISNGDKCYCIINNEYDNFPKADGVEYTTVKPRLVYRLFSKAEKLGGINKKITILVAQILNKLTLFLSIPTWPLISYGYSLRIYRAAHRICKEQKIDFIIPVYTQIDTLIAANKIKKKFPEVKMVPYFLDSFSGGYGPKIFSKEWTVKRGIKWEDKLLPQAEKIVIMKSSEEHYKKFAVNKSYFNKMVFLDLPLYAKMKTNGTKCDLLPKDKINLLYIGTIPMHIRNPEYFLRVFNSVKNDNIQLNIVGNCTDMAFLIEWQNKDSRIKVMPFVDHSTAISLMQNADFLVNFGNNNSHMTPCKIFEYMSIGKPIISTSPIKNEPSSIYLEKYPRSLIIRDYEGDISHDAVKLSEFIDKGFECDENMYSELEQIYYLNTPNAFAEVLNN